MKPKGIPNKKNEEKLRQFLIKQSQHTIRKIKSGPHKLESLKKESN
jgi:hypothetical protein